MSQYIGKTISLISNKGLRYVGLLDNINADDATVALKSVRSFGTEGRMAASGNANLEVHPGTDVYDYVVFRGSDVKDLTVLDTPIDQVKPEPYTQAPAPGGYPAYQQQPQTQTQQQQYKAPAPSTTSAAPAQAASAPTQTSAPKQSTQRPSETQTQSEAPTPSQTQRQPQPHATPTSTYTEETRKEENTSPAQPRPQEHPQSGLPKNTSKVSNVPETAFDFESANAKFSRDMDSEKEAEQPMYNKQSSFFDNISSSADEKNTMRWAEEKNLNLDTFGESSVNNRGRGRGRGRGNWRGGRGNWRGGRGRGRGGNRSNNDYNSKPEWA